MDLSGCEASMKPPRAFLDSTKEVQCGPALVCLKEASDEPVWMSCKDSVPGPVLEDAGAVEQNIVSWKCIVVYNPVVVLRKPRKN